MMASAASGRGAPGQPDAERFAAAAAYSRSQHGVAVLVLRRGEVVFEDYAPGWAEKPHLLASGTKSFSGVIAACAVQDGLLTLDEKAADTLTEGKADARKSALTIRELLSLSSGIDGGDNGSVPSYRRAVEMAEAKSAPGARFSYGPIPFQCFGELMRRKLAPKGESVEGYLKRRVLDPIGLPIDICTVVSGRSAGCYAFGLMYKISPKSIQRFLRSTRNQPSLFFL